jgi:glucose-1-phosphate cytidylyltransferase
LKVVILCGGLGMRLREETEYKPKPMVEIGGRPILWHVMKIYSRYNFKDFVLCLGYKGEYIKDYFLNYRAINNDFMIRLGEKNQVEILSSNHEDFNIILSDTGFNSMTGARVKKIQKYIDEDIFMLTYGDGVGDVNIKELLEFHKKHGKIGTVTGMRPFSRFGELEIQDDQVVSFSEKPLKCDSFVNGGFFVFSRKFFDYLDENDEELTLEKQPLENLASDSQLAVYRHPGFWHAMDTMRDKNYLESLIKSGNAPWVTWKE